MEKKSLPKGQNPKNLQDLAPTKNRIFEYALLLIAFVILVIGIIGIFLSPENRAVSLNDKCVGYIELRGEIVSYVPSADLFGAADNIVSSKEVKELLKDIEKKDNIKALVVLIDSPGGSVVASDEIYRALKKFPKPKVAYLKEIAASGGYYAALGTDYIISDPHALTGSIGAKMTLIELTSLFEKIGYNQTNIKSGEYKDIGDFSKKPTEKEIQMLSALVNETFEDFKNILLQNRANKLKPQYLEDVYQAGIFSGKQAYNIGLVDALGDEEDAIKKASELAGYKENLEVCQLGKKKQGLIGTLLGEFITPLLPKIQININLPKNSPLIEYT